MGIDMSMLSAPISGAWHVVKGIPSLFLTLLVTVVSSVFMTADYEIIKKMLLDFFRAESRDKIVNTKRTITRGVSKLFKAYATLMLITFVEMFIGLSFMKLIVLPLLVCAIMALFNFDADTIIFCTVAAAMPSAAVATMFGSIYSISPSYASQAVGFTTLLSVGTMPLIMLIVPKIIEIL
jgi:hypothetical protein